MLRLEFSKSFEVPKNDQRHVKILIGFKKENYSNDTLRMF